MERNKIISNFNKKPAILFILVAVMFMAGAGCNGDNASDNSLKLTPATMPTLTPTSTSSAQRYSLPTDEEVKEFGKIAETKLMVIETVKGTIKFKFYPKDAPVTAANFIKLAKAKYYDGLAFHRVESGFVIQGGDPQGNGTGGPGYNVKAEFNAQKHLLGTVAMARSQHPDSAGSQFYITLAPQPFLDGKYTVFGQVVMGMEVVQKIKVGDKMTRVYLEE